MSRTRPYLPALALGLLAVIVLSTLFALRGSWGRVWGDESTFLAMAESLAEDGDLLFSEADRLRLEGRSEPSRQTVILQRTGRGISYSKPVLYPLLAAPAFFLFGDAGLPLTNGLMVALSLGLAWCFLRGAGSAAEGSLTLVTYAGASVLVPFVAWAMSDALQVSLALAGLILVVAGERRRADDREPDRWSRWMGSRWAPLLGGLLLGLLTALRYPNALLALGPLGALVWRRRFRTAFGVGLMMVVGLGLASGTNLALAGAASPYKAVRASFNDTTGYPDRGSEPAAEDPFEERLATQSMGLKPRLEPRVSAYSALYFLIGRHSGLLLYFPAALLFAVVAWRRGDSLSRFLLLGAAALAAFYLVWLPRNYFGGATFVGNRYFLVAYPALLVALPVLPGRRSLAAVWALALLVGGSALASVWNCRAVDPSSQSHAHAGLFRLAPLESTADGIGGLEERYWSSEFLRFADPYAEVGEWSFRLSSESPAAEILIGHGRPSGLLRFLVQSDAERIDVIYRDWRGRRTFELETPGGTASGVLEIAAAPAWRRHALRWRPEREWQAAVARLSVRTPDGSPAAADVRYLGPYRLDPKFFDHAALAVELPTEARAGATDEIPIRLRNTGHRPWASRDAVPVHLSYRLVPDEAGLPTVEGPEVELPVRLRRAQNLDASVSVTWPRRPGVYRLKLDLRLGGAVWFEEITGRPLAEGEVRVEGPANPL